MYRIASSVLLGVTVLLIAGHFLVFGVRRRDRTPRRHGHWWECLLVAVLAVSFAVLFVTGFYAAVFLNNRMTGWILMVHTASGAVFAPTLAALAVTWAHLCRFTARDLPRRFQPANIESEIAPPDRFDAAQKAVFWFALAAGVVLIMTIMLSMLKIYGPEGQVLMYEIHRYTALAFAIVAVTHAYRTALGRRRVPGAPTASDRTFEQTA